MNRETTILSMTTYPQRMDNAVAALGSLLLQAQGLNVHPVLVLARDEWEEDEADVRKRLHGLEEYVEILWTDENLRPYNKLLPVMEKWPDHDVITYDDDKWYAKGMIAPFLHSHKMHPEDIIWGRAVEEMYLDEEGNIGVRKFPDNLEPALDTVTRCVKPYFGITGTLYPAHVFGNDTSFWDKDAIRRVDPTCDDSWIYAHALRDGIALRRVCAYLPDINQQANSEKALYKFNKDWYRQIWANIAEYIPEMKRLIAEAIESEKKSNGNIS